MSKDKQPSYINSLDKFSKVSEILFYFNTNGLPDFDIRVSPAAMIRRENAHAFVEGMTATIQANSADDKSDLYFSQLVKYFEKAKQLNEILAKYES